MAPTRRFAPPILLVLAMTFPLAAGEAAKEKLAPLDLKLPPAVTIPSPKQPKADPHVEPLSKTPRPPFLAPEGAANLALKKPVTSSDDSPVVGDLAMITDGVKDAKSDTYVELGPGRQWVQIDLQAPCRLYAIVVWHFFAELRFFHDVVVQVADDADFTTHVRTLYNNDYDNSSGLGIGTDREYQETYEGRLIDAKGEVARYVRLYSKGSTASDLNHYIEAEVYGKPAK